MENLKFDHTLTQEITETKNRTQELVKRLESGYQTFSGLDKSTYRKNLVKLAFDRLNQQITNPSKGEQTELPIYSGFSVFAFAIFKNEYGILQISEGTNYEQISCCAYCAERVAIGAAKASLNRPIGKLVEIILVSTSTTGFVTPGMVCREAISEEAEEDLVITCAGRDGSYKEFNFTEFNPYPNLFIGKRGYKVGDQTLSDLELTAQEFSQKYVNLDFVKLADELGVSSEVLKESYNQAVTIANASQFSNNSIFPLRKTAVAIFANGDFKIVDQLIAVEYTSSDPVSSLVQSYAMEYAKQGVATKVIFQVDKYGILHFPFAWSRSLLREQGLNSLAFKNILLLGYTKLGELKILTANGLVPHSPEFN